MLKALVYLVVLSAGLASAHAALQNSLDYESEETNNERFMFDGDTNTGGRAGGDYKPWTDEPSASRLQELYSWKQLDFVFPNESLRRNMLRNQQFIPLNTIILDADVYENRGRKRVFVSLPRNRPGVPVTLARVSSKRRNGQNLLRAFPNWESQTNGNCGDGYITSVFRIYIDPCGRLWALDTGNNNANAPTGNRLVCNPKILIYDLNDNDRLIGEYRLPRSTYQDNSMMVTIVVDARRDDCSDAFAYMADSINSKMVVFSLESQQFWRVNSFQFSVYPDALNFNIGGVPFVVPGGLFGMGLSPMYGNNKRNLYFNALASVRQSWADTDDLRNQSLWQDNMDAKPQTFRLMSGTRPSQTIVQTMDDDGILYFSLSATHELACWNSRQRFERDNIVSLAKDDTQLQFNSGLKVYGDKLYVTTNRLQNFVTNQVKPDEVNFRIMEGDTRQLTQGTKCQKPESVDRLRAGSYVPNAESVPFPARQRAPTLTRTRQ